MSVPGHSSASKSCWAAASLSDGDVAALQEKLRGREVDYQSLEHSFRRVAGQLQGARTLLQEKEEERGACRCTREGAGEGGAGACSRLCWGRPPWGAA